MQFTPVVAIVAAAKDDGFTLPDWVGDVTNNAITRSLLIFIAASLARKFVHAGIDGFVNKMADITEGDTALGNAARTVLSDNTVALQRRALRAATLGSMAKTITSVLIMSIAVLMIMSEFGFNAAPLLASAGVVGVAMGFGAQSLVKDFLSGIFMLMEDQFGVGDVVNVSPEVIGTVEDVSLRITRIRDASGVLWYVRNGEVLRLGNMSHGWAKVLLDIQVAYKEDLDRVKALMLDEAERMRLDPEWGSRIVDAPEWMGVEVFAPDGITLRMNMKTLPADQFRVTRELRARIKVRFDAEGVEIPFPQRTLWIRHEGEEPPVPTPAKRISQGDDLADLIAAVRDPDEAPEPVPTRREVPTPDEVGRSGAEADMGASDSFGSKDED